MSYAYKAVLQCGHETTIKTQHPHGPGYSYHHAFCEECRLNMAVLKAEPTEDVVVLVTVDEIRQDFEMNSTAIEDLRDAMKLSVQPEYVSFVQGADAEDIPANPEPIKDFSAPHTGAAEQVIEPAAAEPAGEPKTPEGQTE